MEKPYAEVQFIETKKTLESSRTEINKFLKDKTLDEQDRVRLTRVLQLTERYQPDRKFEDEKISWWKKYLESAYRSLPSFKRSQKSIENISEKSYLLAEKTISSLRDLRHIDFQLNEKNQFSEEKILNQNRPTEIKSKETLDTSLTLEYEKKNWGVERICLDGIQNHLPSDSKGEHVWVRCLVNDNWISLAEAKQKKNKIEAVRFVDDGVGFDVKNLILLYSTKAGEKESVGQFGEGIKMIAAAALREGLDLEMESQDWRARPTTKEVKIYDTRNKKDQVIRQLSFQVEHFDGDPMIGSRTTFWKPSKLFLDELMQIDKRVLVLRKNYRPAFIGKNGEIVDREPNRLFVKGIYIGDKNTLFSYNFEDMETNRDRNSVIHEDLEKRIIKIVQEISDKQLIKTILRKGILEPDAIESHCYNIEIEHPKACSPVLDWQ